MDTKSIKDIQLQINKILSNLHNKTITRNRAISFKDFIYVIAYKNSTNKSYDLIRSHLQINKILNVTKSGLTEKRNDINNSYMITLNDELSSYIFKSSSKRLIAVDGSNISLSKKLNVPNIKKEKTYSRMLLSSLFEINADIPINYELFINFNERNALISQLKYVNKGDILVLDRGYYSEDLVYELHKRGIDYIFRLIDKLNKFDKDDVIFTKTIKDVNITCRNIKLFVTRKLKKKSEQIKYTLCTSLFDKDELYFKNIYHKRWNIETDFRFIKHTMSCDNIKSKTINNVRQDIYAHQFLNMIISYCNDKLQKSVKQGYKINKKNSTDIITNNILKLIFYEKLNKVNISNILCLFGYILDKIVKIQEGRYYPRLRMSQGSKWCNTGKVFIKR